MKLDRTVIIAGIAGFCIVFSVFWKAIVPAVHEVFAANTSSRSEQNVLEVASLYRAAETAQLQGRLVEAVAAYEKALDVIPDMAETYLRLGQIYFKLGLPSKAQEFYVKAVDHGLSDPEVYFHLGYIEEVRNVLDKALEYYLKAEKGGSRNPELFYNIGNAYARLEKKAEAVIYYKRVVSMNPLHMDAFVNLSVVSFQMKEYADARFYLDKAVALGYKAPEEYLKVMPP